MPTTTRIRLNPAAVQELKRSPEVFTYCRRKATEAEQIARATAPRGATGGFAESIFSDGDMTEGRCVLGTEDMAGIWIETGTVNNPAYSTLRNAVVTVGLRLDATPPR